MDGYTLSNYKHNPHPQKTTPHALYIPNSTFLPPAARYYHSVHSFWLSVDPLADKYPNLSPYAYCAGNPVRYFDGDGRDYEVVVDKETKTITIKAQYYTANENKGTLQQGLDLWNEQSGLYSFVSGHGKNKEKYAVLFDLSIVSGDFETDDEAYQAFSNDNSKTANYVVANGSQQKGETASGHYIQLNPIKAGRRTMAHEVGHTLGLSEWSFGLMKSGGTEDQITRKNIQQILFKAGIGHKPSTYSLYNNPLKSDQSHLGAGQNMSNYHKNGYVW